MRHTPLRNVIRSIWPRPALPAHAPLPLSHAYVSIPKPPATQPTAQAARGPPTDSASSEPGGLGLPAPGEGEPIILDVSGNSGSSSSSAKLSHLGPLVVNVDGTLARITNWAQMTQAERDTTVRIVGKRNRERLEAVRRRKEAGAGGS